MIQHCSVAFVAIFFMFLIGGCANPIRDYTASAINVKTIKEKYNQSGVKIKIGSFTSDEPNKKSIGCSAVGPITLPTGKSFGSYIIDSLILELKFAGIYSDISKTSIQIHFEKIDFSSVVGKWEIIAKLSAENGVSFMVESAHKFDTGYQASLAGYQALACSRVSEEFPEAVKIFIATVTSHPEFARIVNH